MTTSTDNALSEATLPEVAVPKGRVFALLQKEFWSLLVSPISWIVFLLLYVFRGGEVVRLLERFQNQGDVDAFPTFYLLQASTQYMVVMVPAILTMRAFAEEKRTGSLELLMTAPVRDWEVVVAKWIAAWFFYALLWLPSFVVLIWLGAELNVSFPMGQVFSSYVGLLGVGSLLLAFGLFMSSLTDNQLLASLTSILFSIGLIAIPAELVKGQNQSDGGFGAMLLSQAHVIDHWQKFFFSGRIETGHLVFYASTALLFLFLTVRVVESRKWR